MTAGGARHPAVREELLELLCAAAEFEHGVCCAYLFPAFALRRLPQDGLGWAELERNRRWAAELQNIAREEMGHLATVSNLLTVLGGTPHYTHPPFPYRAAGTELELRTLDPEVAAAFVRLESAEGADGGGAAGVGELYGRVRALLEQADDDVVVPAEHQLRITLPTAVRITTIDDRGTAIRAVSSIVEDGDTGPTSHRERLLRVQREVDEAWGDRSENPSRPVAANPSLEPGERRTHITDPNTRAVLELFEAAYGAMLLILGRLGHGGPEAPQDTAMLAAVAYYPFMTMVLRPLGEALTSLPTGASDGSHAGPSFRAPRQTALPEERPIAWRRLAEVLDSLVDGAEKVESGGMLGPRGTYLRETLHTLARRFRAGPEEWC